MFHIVSAGLPSIKGLYIGKAAYLWGCFIFFLLASPKMLFFIRRYQPHGLGSANVHIISFTNIVYRFQSVLHTHARTHARARAHTHTHTHTHTHKHTHTHSHTPSTYLSTHARARAHPHTDTRRNPCSHNDLLVQSGSRTVLLCAIWLFHRWPVASPQTYRGNSTEDTYPGAQVRLHVFR